eukprot:5266385-Pyramimonas_sp.AAC.1
MPVRCPYCRANDRGSIAALLPGPPPSEAQATLQLMGGVLAPIRPHITCGELAAATAARATELDYLRADLMTIRRPNTYITVMDMRRIQEYVADSRRSQCSQKVWT